MSPHLDAFGLLCSGSVQHCIWANGSVLLLFQLINLVTWWLIYLLHPEFEMLWPRFVLVIVSVESLSLCLVWLVFSRMCPLVCDQMSIQEIQMSDPVSFAVSSLCHVTVSKYSDAVGHILVRKRYLKAILVIVFLETSCVLISFDRKPYWKMEILWL